MLSSVTFVLDGSPVTVDFANGGYAPTTTLLQYLRSLPDHKGTKEGCAEGDCGACTVVLAEPGGNHGVNLRAVDSCLIFLPMIHGKQVITVEDVAAEDGGLHPVQKAMAVGGGSQCGYCTPGFIMSMYALSRTRHTPSRDDIDDALTGNLCRCTGYRPIVQAMIEACARGNSDGSSGAAGKPASEAFPIPAGSLTLTNAKQKYFRPVSLGEAVTLKHGHPDALLLAGATDIALRVTKGHELLPGIIDLSGIDELKAFSETGGAYQFGAGMTLTDVMTVAERPFPALAHMLAVFGSRQIRNVATIGGNLGTASPIGDLLPVLMACDASVVLESLNGRREVRVNEYFTGYRKTVRRAEEIIVGVIIPRPAPGRMIRSYKISKRKDMDISSVSAAFSLGLDNGRVKDIVLAFGGMADRPMRAAAAERYLAGREWLRNEIIEAMSLIGSAFTPLSDVRASARFRTAVAGNLLLKFWSETHNNHHAA